MKETGKRLFRFKQEFVAEVIYQCGALGLSSVDIGYDFKNSEGLLTVTATAEGFFSVEASLEVGNMKPKFAGAIVEDLKVLVEMECNANGYGLAVAECL